MNRTATVLALTLMTSAGFVPALAIGDDIMPQFRCGVGEVQQPNVEVVFVLDTTGSMSGLIEGAKQKIWSIASEIAQAQPSPQLKMGLVGYRDRGDNYITTRTALTDDIDTVYEKLMGFSAGGGGDTPESVNQALYEAIERFDWSDDPSTLKIVFLVGDAPPQMGYEDDVKYQASCKLAAERGIMVNTIQCGNLKGTKGHWTKIANLTNGAYAAIAQDAGVQRIVTPYDQEIRALDQDMASLMIDYGTEEVMWFSGAKRTRSSKVSSGSSLEAAADRAVYNQSAAGRKNLYGVQELVDDINTGAVSIDELKESELPASLKGKTKEELKAIVAQNSARRSEIQSRLGELAGLRRAYQEKARQGLPGDGFDMQILKTLQKQGASIGLKFAGSSTEDSKGTKGGKSKD